MAFRVRYTKLFEVKKCNGNIVSKNNCFLIANSRTHKACGKYIIVVEIIVWMNSNCRHCVNLNFNQCITFTIDYRLPDSALETTVRYFNGWMF